MTIPQRMREAARIANNYSNIYSERDHGYDSDGTCERADKLADQLRTDADTIERVIVSMEPFARTAEVAEWIAALKGETE